MREKFGRRKGEKSVTRNYFMFWVFSPDGIEAIK
jgi:hypothetical protein